MAAKRTPFGRYGGVFKDTDALALQVAAGRAALEAADIRPDHVDSVIIGQVKPFHSDGGHLTQRHVQLHLGIPIERPAITIDRLCGSGFQSVVNGAQVSFSHVDCVV